MKEMQQKGYRYPCGCMEGYYWCDKHDIYVKQDRIGDPRWNGEWLAIAPPALTEGDDR